MAFSILFPSSKSSRRSLLISISTLLILLLVLPQSTSASTKLYPAKRSYDTHTYYVLHLRSPTESSYSAIDIAKLLGAEHVEKVGELQDHYLIRAPSDLVIQGAEGGLSLGSREKDVSEVAFSNLLERRNEITIERDSVMERYALLRRDGGDCDRMSTLEKRDGGGGASEGVKSLGIRSLERQIPRMRIKRDLPVLPPVDSPFTIPSMENSLLNHLEARVPIPQVPVVIPLTAEPAGIVKDAIDQFGIYDPIFPLQWHILNKVMEENSVNVTGVWAQGIVGKGINVAIVDDGLDMFSRDLAPNYVRNTSLFWTIVL